jgi:hypothetical protein
VEDKLSHKCEHGKDSDVCVRCAEESHDQPRGAKTADHGRGAGRPMNDSVAATGHIHLRVVMARKNWYVRMARLHNLTLAEWMQRECDEASGYPPKSQLVTANATS